MSSQITKLKKPKALDSKNDDDNIVNSSETDLQDNASEKFTTKKTKRTSSIKNNKSNPDDLEVALESNSDDPDENLNDLDPNATDLDPNAIDAENCNTTLNNKKVIFDVLTDIVNTYKPKSVIRISNLLKDRGYDYSDHRIRTLLSHANIHKIYDEQGDRYYKVLNEKSLANKDNLIHNFIASINHNDVMIVIKTTIAGAPLVAKLIDFNSHMLDVLGTVAGDDTVIIIPRKASECTETFNKIYNFLMK